MRAVNSRKERVLKRVIKITPRMFHFLCGMVQSGFSGRVFGHLLFLLYIPENHADNNGVFFAFSQ